MGVDYGGVGTKEGKPTRYSRIDRMINKSVMFQLGHNPTGTFPYLDHFQVFCHHISNQPSTSTSPSTAIDSHHKDKQIHSNYLPPNNDSSDLTAPPWKLPNWWRCSRPTTSSTASSPSSLSSTSSGPTSSSRWPTSRSMPRRCSCIWNQLIKSIVPTRTWDPQQLCLVT